MPPAGMRPGVETGFLARARALAQRAEALGGLLVSWSAMTLAFSFDSDALEEAVDLVASVVTEAVQDDARWACGIARGDMESLWPTATVRSDLAWGEPLIVSLTLARVARSAEVLVHPSAVGPEGALRLVETRAANDGGVEVRGHKLDTQNPWRTRPSAAKPVKPDPSARDAAVQTAPKIPASPRPPEVTESPRPLPPPRPPPRPSVTNEAMLERASPLAASPPPPVVQASVSAEPPTIAASPPTVAVSPPTMAASPPSFVDETAVARSRDAFLARDRAALERASTDLRDAHGSFATRVRAFADLTRGDTGTALRALERSKAEARGVARAQASLALAVALAGIGRLDDALLEALDALARARELGDAAAMRATVRFLEQLTDARRRAELVAGDVDDVGIDVDVDVDLGDAEA